MSPEPSDEGDSKLTLDKDIFRHAELTDITERVKHWEHDVLSKHPETGNSSDTGQARREEAATDSMIIGKLCLGSDAVTSFQKTYIQIHRNSYKFERYESMMREAKGSLEPIVGESLVLQPPGWDKYSESVQVQADQARRRIAYHFCHRSSEGRRLE